MSGVPSRFNGPQEPDPKTLLVEDDPEPQLDPPEEYPDERLPEDDLFTAYLMSGVPSLLTGPLGLL